MPTGIKIKEIRQQKGLTQKQLGDMCGIADANIRKYENGKQNPKIETLQKIANALDEPLSIFLDDELFDASTTDEDYGTNHVSEVLDRRIKEITESTTLSRDEKLEQLDDLITSGNIILKENINHSTVAQKQLLCSYFDELNIHGRDKALDQVEMLTKIPEFLKEPTKQPVIPDLGIDLEI